jgi:tryptophan halogenase
MKKEIVIVGGGTAGWLTALYVQKMFGREANISLIESDKIGILGAGEGTIPIFISTLTQLKIDFYDFFNKTNATYKVGINFENWNGDGTNYYHAFGVTDGKYSPYSFDDDNPNPYNVSIGNEYIGYLIKNGLSINDYVLSNSLLKNNKLPFFKDENDIKISNYYALHFDAILAAKYFRKIAEKRGVKRIEGVVSRFNQNENGDITHINLKNGIRVKTNFVFDCSGFERLIIGNLFKSNWKSYKEHLTVNSSIPFFLPMSDDINVYTKAVAMKYGWMWQIPLQNRWGCGYIFDDNYINSDEAKKEVEELLGHDITVNKLIKFDAGRYEKIWINNCISIGLSSGFIEPLEATSIWVSINMLDSLNKQHILNPTKEIVDSYNNKFTKMNDDILDFLQFHYITKRKDTEFWKYYSEKAPMQISLKQMDNKWKNDCPTLSDFTNFNSSLFGWHSYIYVGLGLGYFDNNLFIKEYDKFTEAPLMESHHQKNMNTINYIIDKSYSVSDSLKNFKI